MSLILTFYPKLTLTTDRKVTNLHQIYGCYVPLVIASFAEK